MGTSFITQVFGEFIGTMFLVLLGDGIVTGVELRKTKSNNAGWLAIMIGWGLAVTFGVFLVSWMSLGHLNPAVSIAMAIAGKFNWGLVLPYIIAQILGAIAGAILVWLTYFPHWAETKDSTAILGCFSTVPAIRNYFANFFSEFIGAFVLVYGLLALSKSTFSAGLNPIAAGLLITGIGLTLGGPTGCAINPARDLGPRIAHQFLPIVNKGDSDWAYSWVPIFAPISGGIIAALIYNITSNMS